MILIGMFHALYQFGYKDNDSKMKWMETIKISIAENRRAALEKQLTAIVTDLNTAQNAQIIKIYHNLQDGDMCIHLSWSNGTAHLQGSKTGLFLAHLLKEFGLTSHSVWIEKE